MSALWHLGEDRIEEESAGRTDCRGGRTSLGTENTRDRRPVGAGFAARILAGSQLIGSHGPYRGTGKSWMGEIDRPIYDSY